MLERIVNQPNFSRKEKIDLFEILSQTVMVFSMTPGEGAKRKLVNSHMECDFSGVPNRRRLKLRILITSYSNGLR